MDTAQLHIRADAKPEHIEHIGLYRNMSSQILDVEEDLLDPQLRYIEQDIRLCRRLSAPTMPAGVTPSLRELAGAHGVVFHVSSFETLANAPRVTSRIR